MDTDCLKHALTEEERIRFERDGYFVLEDAMSTTQVAGLTEAYDRIVDEACAGGQIPTSDLRFATSCGATRCFSIFSIGQPPCRRCGGFWGGTSRLTTPF